MIKVNWSRVDNTRPLEHILSHCTLIGNNIRVLFLISWHSWKLSRLKYLYTNPYQGVLWDMRKMSFFFLI